MQNKPHFFFGNRGSQKGGRGGSDTWEKFPKNPVFFCWQRPLDFYVSEETRFYNWTFQSYNSGNFINLLPTDLTSIGNMYGSAHCFGFSYRMKNMFLSTSQPFVSGTPAVCQKFPGPALVPGEEDGKEEEEGEGADEKADEGEELHAEGQTGRQRLCWQ